LAKRKIAVLGGGCGSLAAVYALTSTAGWDERFEICVYQMGWRLGGKGASGRNQNPDRGQRIEEHGLHVWGGFYHHAFGMMRGVYAELERKHGTPLSVLFDESELDVGNAPVTNNKWPRWLTGALISHARPGRDQLRVPVAAFRPQRDVVLMEHSYDDNKQAGAKSSWKPWCMQFPSNPYTWKRTAGVARDAIPAATDVAEIDAFDAIAEVTTYLYDLVHTRYKKKELTQSFDPKRLTEDDLSASVRDLGVAAEILAWRPPVDDQPEANTRKSNYTNALRRVHRFASDESNGQNLHNFGNLKIRIDVAVALNIINAFGPKPTLGELAHRHLRALHLVTATAQVVQRSHLPDNNTANKPPAVLAELATQLSDVVALFEAMELFALVEEASDSDDYRRSLILFEIGRTVVSGIIGDSLWLRGFEAADRYDLREWMLRHRSYTGWTDIAANSACIDAGYDYAFAYNCGRVGIEPNPNDSAYLGSPRGNDDHAKIAAGTAMKGLLQLVLAYRGAIFWEMTAGMGDVVFAPLYEILKKRGVQFRFFHRVDGLELADDKRNIERIVVVEQARVPGGNYEPFIYPYQDRASAVPGPGANPQSRRDQDAEHDKGPPCWPSEPNYGQILRGEVLRQCYAAQPPDGKFKYDLESVWNVWDGTNGERKTLVKGHDFDDVILGISIGDFPHLCRELIAADERWRDMVDHIGVTRTCAVQLWLNETTETLGWPPAEDACSARLRAPILSGFAHYLNTWADLSHLINAEVWDGSNTESAPQSIAYFCGPYFDKNTDRMRRDDPDAFRRDQSIPRDAIAAIRTAAVAWATTHLRHIWDSLASDDTPAKVDALRKYLVRPLPRDGHRGSADQGYLLRDQYVRVNVNPSDLYVLALPGSTRYRLRAGGSGFANLYLAGDWVRTSLNSGNVESAVMAGYDAAMAIDPVIPADPLHRIAFLAGQLVSGAAYVADGVLAEVRDSAMRAVVAPDRR